MHPAPTGEGSGAQHRLDGPAFVVPTAAILDAGRACSHMRIGEMRGYERSMWFTADGRAGCIPPLPDWKMGHNVESTARRLSSPPRQSRTPAGIHTCGLARCTAAGCKLGTSEGGLSTI